MNDWESRALDAEAAVYSLRAENEDLAATGFDQVEAALLEALVSDAIREHRFPPHALISARDKLRRSTGVQSGSPLPEPDPERNER